MEVNINLYVSKKIGRVSSYLRWSYDPTYTKHSPSKGPPQALYYATISLAGVARVRYPRKSRRYLHMGLASPRPPFDLGSLAYDRRQIINRDHYHQPKKHSPPSAGGEYSIIYNLFFCQLFSPIRAKLSNTVLFTYGRKTK